MYLVTTEQFEVDGELFYEGVSWKDYIKSNKESNIKHGRLYNFYAITDSRNITPNGWHIPTLEEMSVLSTLGNNIIFNPNGLNITLSGDYSYFYNSYININITAAYHYNQSLNPESSNPEIFYFDYNPYNNVFIKYPQSQQVSRGFSIRLIKDNNIDEGDVIDIDGNIYQTIKIGDQVWMRQNLATTHYRNGDLISNDFSDIFGAVTAYKNDESYVYDFNKIIIKGFKITYNNKFYFIPLDKAIETPRFTREQNIPFGEYQYRTHSDKTPEYFKRVEEYFGIDMKENYAAQFRDGKNPHKDINGSIFKENPDQ